MPQLIFWFKLFSDLLEFGKKMNRYQYDCVQVIMECENLKAHFLELQARMDRENAAKSPEMQKKISDLIHKYLEGERPKASIFSLWNTENYNDR